MFLTALLAASLSAPVPKNELKAKIEKAFGTIIDPKGDSKFTLDGDALTVTLPADVVRGFGATTVNAKQPGGEWGRETTYHNDVPRVEFNRSGDFVLTVRVHTPLDEDAKPAKDSKDRPHTVGGVLVLAKGGGWERLAIGRERWSQGVRTAVLNDGAEEEAARNRRPPFHVRELGGEIAWLRMTRTGKSQLCEVSADGEKWVFQQGDADAFLTDSVTLALYAQHGSDKAHLVTFDQFKIEELKAIKK